MGVSEHTTLSANVSGMPNLAYGVDGEGRNSGVSASSGQNPITSTTYDPASHVLDQYYGSGDSDSFTYDPDSGRMKQWVYNVGTKQVSANLNWNPNGTLSYLSITDPLNALNQQTCSTYSYDDFGRLTQVTCGTTWAQTFTYDSFGNIKKTEGNQMWMPTYDSANNNRYQTGGGISYDLNGNLLSDTFNTYAWDGNWGNPASVNGNALVYDALGRMVENTSSAGTREYIYGPGGSQPLAQMNGRRSPC
jgi:YD repeat-containing protein